MHKKSAATTYVLLMQITFPINFKVRNWRYS